MIRRALCGVALAALFIAPPAWAGIEEHSPDPTPESNLYDGFVMGRSLEGVKLHEGAEEDTEETTTVTAFDVTATAPDAMTELQMQWMFAQVGILYEPLQETAAGGMAHTPHNLPANNRPHEVAREPGRQPSADPADPSLDSAEGALASDDDPQQDVGCTSTSPTTSAWALLLLAAAALVRSRRYAPER